MLRALGLGGAMFLGVVLADGVAIILAKLHEDD
jgi:hypothetical protein